MSSLFVALVVCLLCFSRGLKASTTVTIVTTSSTTTTTTKTEPISPDETSTQPAPQKCPVVTPESGSGARKTGSVQERFLHISADPPTITEGETGRLDINCTFWGVPEAQVNMTGSIGIYRIRDVGSRFGLEKQEMVSVGAGNKDKTVQTENLFISGHVDQTGFSYLNLTITSPNSTDEGLYRCTVLGFDTNKVPFLAQKSIKVGPRASVKLAPSKEFSTTSPPITDATPEPNVNLVQLKKKVESMQSAFDNIKKQVVDMEEFQSNVNTRLTKIKSSLFMDPIEVGPVDYYVSKTSFSTFSSAQATCEIFGGFLAVVDDQKQLEEILSPLGEIFEGDVVESSNADVEGILIGGTYNEQDGNWSTSHNDSPFFKWKGSGIQPADPKKKCIVLLKKADWDMSDEACTNENSNFRFLCKIPRRK